jgi:hypothetical protein
MQGSAIQTRGGSQQGRQVIFTSYADDTVGDDANGDGIDSTPRPGDWGGLVLRNFDDISNGRAANPVLFPVNGALGLSGADDVMSAVNFANIRYAGGAVPQTIGQRYNAITMFNSRPAITNVRITDTGGAGSAQAAISGDFDSFREDSIARGPLVRRATLTGNSLNGIWVQPNSDGYATEHRTLYRVHQRVAKRYREGRAFLAGDAAHINNPLGGMGMNGGLHDALSLTEKLVAVHRGETDDASLDRYERQRRPIAIDYINANTARNKKALEERDAEARERNRAEMRRTADDPEAARAFLRKSSMIDALRASAAIS